MAKETVQASAPAEQTASTTARQGTQPVKIDTSELKSSYCNVCNASSTREEVVLNFGINEVWDRGAKEVEVALEHRVILSPFAAKRLAEMLNRLMDEYETRHGALK
jgi:hypothetical protein